MKNIIKLSTIVLAGSLALTACKNEAKDTKKEEPKKTETITSATTGTTDKEQITKGLSSEGGWLTAVNNSVTFEEDVVVSGEFKNNKGEVARELALYTTDKDKKVEFTYNFRTPSLIIQSPNFKIAQGTVVGNVYVEAEGFGREGTGAIDGNLYFKTQELYDAYMATDAANQVIITNGEIIVGY